MSKDVFIVDGIRSGIGSLGGSLSNLRADDLAGSLLKRLLERHPNFNSSAVEEVLLGCANQAGEDNRNVARMSLLLAGLPISVGGETVNRLCASGMAATVNAVRAIKDGAGEVYIAGGVEQMTRAPYVLSKASSAYGRDMQLADSSFGWRFINPKMEELYGVEAMGLTAENLVEKYQITREEQDCFACWSQEKTRIAQQSGFYDDEIVPLSIPINKKESVLFSTDEFSRPSTNMESLSKLKAAFKVNGSVTAGNSSGLNDGAAALLIASALACENHHFSPLTRVVSAAVAGVHPSVMGIGPVAASTKALERAGLTMDQMDIIEINEAFAAQVLACLKLLNIETNDKRINPNGGAISLGHPLGMSGARILLTASRELVRTNKRYALVTMCIGVGQGYAVVLERI